MNRLILKTDPVYWKTEQFMIRQQHLNFHITKVHYSEQQKDALSHYNMLLYNKQ